MSVASTCTFYTLYSLSMCFCVGHVDGLVGFHYGRPM